MFLSSRVAHLLAVFMLCVAVGAQAKPRPPVSLSLQAEGQPGAALFAFSVTATTAFETSELVITVHPPQGASLAEGALSWHGPLPANGSKSLGFTLRFNDVHGVVRATAAVTSPDGPRYAAHAVQPVGEAPAAKARAASSRHAQRFGRGVVEFRLDR